MVEVVEGGGGASGGRKHDVGLKEQAGRVVAFRDELWTGAVLGLHLPRRW